MSELNAEDAWEVVNQMREASDQFIARHKKAHRLYLSIFWMILLQISISIGSIVYFRLKPVVHLIQSERPCYCQPMFRKD